MTEPKPLKKCCDKCTCTDCPNCCIAGTCDCDCGCDCCKK